MHAPIPAPTNRTVAVVVDASMTVHTVLGPGLLESTYLTCLAYELRKRGLSVETQVELPIHYDGIVLDSAYRIDLLVDNEVVVEVKAVVHVHPVHEAQILSYLKLSRKRVGLLINFNVVHLRDGIARFVN
jgi:GxxExxY protein